ncbi:MAG: hypothetical protein K2H01_03460 [Ruminococcus sp.]|nr:hypothetical protein [Ruminococcus sp.]
MKKLSKVLSPIISFAILAGAVSYVQVSAEFTPVTETPSWYWGTISNINIPEGYEVFDSNENMVIYRNIENHYYLLNYTNLKYNKLFINLNDSNEWESIYNKYLADLDFNKIELYDTSAILYDVVDAGDNQINPTTITNKMKDISDVCAKMYEDGVIDKSQYTGITANYFYSTIMNTIACKIDCSESEFKNIISKHSNNTVISSSNDPKHGVIWTVEFNNIKNVEELYKIIDAVSAEDGVLTAHEMSYANNSFDSEVFSRRFNLLDPYICDIDGSGKADIADATVILKAYAESAVGLQKAAADNKMDVNGDGEVNIEDATYVLTYYAEAAAGIR